MNWQRNMMLAGLLTLVKVTALAADVIDVPLPKSRYQARLGTTARYCPVVNEQPVTATVTLPRGIFLVTAHFLYNGKIDGFEDYRKMTVQLKFADNSVGDTVGNIMKSGVLSVPRIMNAGAPMKVSIYCFESAAMPWGTPEPVALAFQRKMTALKRNMRLALEGKDVIDPEVDDDAVLTVPIQYDAIDAMAVKIPMLLLDRITIERLEDIPETVPYIITVDAPKTLPDGPGLFSATVTVTKTVEAGDAGTLVSTFTHRDGRVFWQQETPLRYVANKAVVTLDIPHPDLPPGQYVLNNWLKDGAGKVLAEFPPLADALTEYFSPGSRAGAKLPPLPTAAVRTPIARMQSYLDLGRELLWGLWEQTAGEIDNPRMAEIGLNTGSYQFPYRWSPNFSDWNAMGGWPEDLLSAVKAPAGGYKVDPGFVVLDQWDERGMVPWADPEQVRLDLLRLWRVPRAWPPPMSTITDYNRRSGNDCLSWDEVDRKGFPGHGTAKGDIDGVFQAFVFDNIGLRIEQGRRENPYVNHSTGMGAGCDQHFFDSMHNRIFGHSATVEEYAHFVQAVPRYGLRPWTYLVNVDSGRAEHVRRIMWIAVAAGGRCMPFFELGSKLVDRGNGPRKGELTPQGQWARETIARLQPLSPILMSVRNRLNPEVLFWDPTYYLPNDGVLEGLLANGVQPEVGRDPARRKLIILHGTSVSEQDFTSVRRAVEAGACLFLTAEADNGANGPKAFGLTLTGLDDLVLDEGTTSLPTDFNKVVHRKVDKPERDMDLTPLAEYVPGFAGLTIKAKPGPLGELAADSPLKRILAKDRTTLGYVGQVGKGRVVILNAHLSSPGNPPNQARNRAAHGTLLGAVLQWAGVSGAFRCTDPGSNRISQEALGIELATKDLTQSYVIIVPEYNADLAFRPADPAVRVVRDLCTGTILPWKADTAGRYVNLKLSEGQGTLLALVKSDPVAGFAVTPAVLGAAMPAKEVTGGQTLYLGVSRKTGGATIADAHTFRVTAKGPDGKVIPGFTEWETGVGPVAIKLPVAVTDPDGTWTIEVQDLTDGAVGQAMIEKRKGYQPDKTETKPGVVAAALGVTPVPYTLEMESVPRLEGDIIIATIRGKLRSTVAGEQDAVVTVGIPAAYVLNGTNRIPLRVKGGQATPFEVTFCAHRDQFLTVYNGFDYAKEGTQTGTIRIDNDAGIRIRADIAGKTVAQAKWTTDILRWLRKPNRIGTLKGGEISVLVENLSDKDRQVDLSSDVLPGWAGNGWHASQPVPAGKRLAVKQTVTWANSAKADPGYHWLPLAVQVDGKTFPEATMFVDEDYEQQWWCRLLPADGSEADPEQKDLQNLQETTEGAPATLPENPDPATLAEWTSIICQSVLWSGSVSKALGIKDHYTDGTIVVASYVSAPGPCEVKAGFLGPKAPRRIWINDVLVEADWAKVGSGAVEAKPVALKQGLNTVMLELDFPFKDGDAISLVLQDPKSGKRDRKLVVGADTGVK